MDINEAALDELLERPIAYNRAFAKISGGLVTGVIISQLYYWSKVKNHQEFYKTNEEIMEECLIGRDVFYTAIKKIETLGIFERIKKGMPAKTFYKVNLRKIMNLVNNLNNNNSLYSISCSPETRSTCSPETRSTCSPETRSTCSPETRSTCSPETRSTCSPETRSTLNITETTTETTTDITLKNYKKDFDLEKNLEQKVEQPPSVNNLAIDKKPNQLLFDYSGFDEQQVKAIESWFVYRKEAKKTYKTKSSLTALRNKMLELKASGSLIEAINNSIAMEYMGLFSPIPVGRYAPPLAKKKDFNYVHDYTNNKPLKQVDTL